MRSRIRAHPLRLVGVIAIAAVAPAIPQAFARGVQHRPAFTDRPLLNGVQPPPIPAATRPRRATGPVHPVRGAVTYGEGDAGFGADRGGRMHEGQDIFAPVGTPVVAVRDAVVLETGGGDDRGNYAALYSGAAHQTYVYLHMDGPADVRPSAHVHAGQRVGALGCSGSCFGPHLHFEVRIGRGVQAPAIDPLPLLRRWHHSG